MARKSGLSIRTVSGALVAADAATAALLLGGLANAAAPPGTA
jgi:hypothetical protein